MIMKKLMLAVLFTLCFITPSFAQDITIIPETQQDVWGIVERVGEGWKVWDNYNKEADTLQSSEDLWAQMASGIFTWETILDYLVYVIKFLSQAGLFVGACFIIFAGYIYGSSALTWSDVWKGKIAIKNAVIGVIVITFSYAIMKIITAAFIN